MKNGTPRFEYNYFGVERTNIAGTTALPAGMHEIRYEFTPESPKPGAGGRGVLFVDGKKVGEGRIPKTQPSAFSGDEGTDVGMDGETAVSKDYEPATSRFSGKIAKVTAETKPAP